MVRYLSKSISTTSIYHPLLFSSPIDPEFALPSPSQANPPSAPCRHRQPRQHLIPVTLPPGVRHGANFKGPVVAGRAQTNQKSEPLSSPQAVVSEPAFPTRQAEPFLFPSHAPPGSHPGQPRTWPADHAPRSWPVGSSGAPIFGGWMSVCLRRVSERASLHGRDAG